MRCAQFRTALSARLDGEPTGLPDRRLDKHLARCEACRGWQEQAERLRGRTAGVDPDGPSAAWSTNLLASLGGRGSGAGGPGVTGGPGQGDDGSGPER
ncbi:zf-HC2 domain-containing protein [Kitasatospora sp. NPDC001603]|uniref:zf-HC2 domain-containing protein n=1 Tax=Kitasatospora sp. NPDC001603 TaxID=3154388 RepID=UPI0033281A95